MFRDALVLCDLDTDPTEGVRFAARGADRRPKDVLDQDQLAGVLKATAHESDDVRAMIWVGFSTGMRFGELSSLLWSDVDFDKKCIHVRKSQVNGIVGPTKKRGYRTVPLHPLVADVLRRQQRWVETQAIRCVDAGMVFPSNVGSSRPKCPCRAVSR